MSESIAKKYNDLKREAGIEYEKVLNTRDTRDTIITIGTATCGRSAGATEVLEAIQKTLREHNLQARVVTVGCHGHCYAEPLVTIFKSGWPRIVYGNVTTGLAPFLVKNFLVDNDPCLEWALGSTDECDSVPSVYCSPRFGGETRRLLKRCGIIDPGNILHYIATDGYKGLAIALSSEPEKIIEEIGRSGLRGLGGAGFPTGEKWELARAAAGSEKYVVCNCDEGDPGAFMDRALIESDPQAIVEGMILAGYAIGAANGMAYVRDEYPLAVERLTRAAQQAREMGLLGKNILDSGFDFDIRIARGAGAFVCGEETALIESLEGRRGMPRHRPPYPVESGYKEKPTLVNNTKTLAYVPWIIVNGADAFASVGAEKSKGTAVFALAGKIRHPGLVEVAMGATLRHVIFDIGGGVPPLVKPSQVPGEKPVAKKRKFKAVQIGGPSGGCLPESLLDTPIDFDSLKAAGAIMGSGGMVVMDEDNCMVRAARYFLEFTQKESCGKCTFCRIGTKHMLDLLTGITKGEGRAEDLDLLRELADNVKQGSLCNLGRTAPNPVLTTLRYFRDEYVAHIDEKKCPAHECVDLVSYFIVLERCRRTCDACVGSCPAEAIYTRKDRLKAIDQKKCVKCYSCTDACPPEYDAVIRVSPVSALPELKPDKEE